MHSSRSSRGPLWTDEEADPFRSESGAARLLLCRSPDL